MGIQAYFNIRERCIPPNVNYNGLFCEFISPPPIKLTDVFKGNELH